MALCLTKSLIQTIISSTPPVSKIVTTAKKKSFVYFGIFLRSMRYDSSLWF